jgi:hypothetical protein
MHRPRSKGSGHRTVSLSGMGSKSPLMPSSPMYSRVSSPESVGETDILWRKFKQQLIKPGGSPLSSPKQSRRLLQSPLINNPKSLDALGLHPASPKVPDNVINDFLSFRVEKVNKEKPRQEILEAFRKFSKDLDKRIVRRTTLRKSAAVKQTASPSTSSVSAAGTRPSGSTTSTVSSASAVSLAPSNQNVAPSPPPTDTVKEKVTGLRKPSSKLNPNAQEFKPLAMTLSLMANSVVPQPPTSTFFPANRKAPYIDTQQPISEVYFKALKVKTSGLISLVTATKSTTPPLPLSPSSTIPSLSPRDTRSRSPTPATSSGSRKPHEMSVLWEPNTSHESWKRDLLQPADFNSNYPYESYVDALYDVSINQLAESNGVLSVPTYHQEFFPEQWPQLAVAPVNTSSPPLVTVTVSPLPHAAPQPPSPASAPRSPSVTTSVPSPSSQPYGVTAPTYSSSPPSVLRSPTATVSTSSYPSHSASQSSPSLPPRHLSRMSSSATSPSSPPHDFTTLANVPSTTSLSHILPPIYPPAPAVPLLPQYPPPYAQASAPLAPPQTPMYYWIASPAQNPSNVVLPVAVPPPASYWPATVSVPQVVGAYVPQEMPHQLPASGLSSSAGQGNRSQLPSIDIVHCQVKHHHPVPALLACDDKCSSTPGSTHIAFRMTKRFFMRTICVWTSELQVEWYDSL